MSTNGHIPEFSRVALTEDLPAHSLRAGDIGAVVTVYDGGAGYAVEFFSLTGQTVAVAVVRASQVRPVEDREVASARRLAG
jgi:hypothetical protein